jgi:hypothetical protein
LAVVIVLAGWLIGRAQSDDWWSDAAQPILDLGAIAVLGLPVVLPLSGVAGMLRRAGGGHATAWSSALIVVQGVWVTGMAWFAAWGYDVRDNEVAPQAVWLLCGVWAGLVLLLGAPIEELLARRGDPDVLIDDHVESTEPRDESAEPGSV